MKAMEIELHSMDLCSGLSAPATSSSLPQECSGRRQRGVLVSAKQGSGETNSSPNTLSWLKKQHVIWSSFSAAC